MKLAKDEVLTIDKLRSAYGISADELETIASEADQKETTAKYGKVLIRDMVNPNRTDELIQSVEDAGYREIRQSSIKCAVTVTMDINIAQTIDRSGMYASAVISKGAQEYIGMDEQEIVRRYSELNLHHLVCNKRVSLPVELYDKIKTVYGPSRMVAKFMCVAALAWLEDKTI